jgi:hypothetical protein
MDALLRPLADLRRIVKIGEGTFGEAYKGGSLVFKVGARASAACCLSRRQLLPQLPPPAASAAASCCLSRRQLLPQPPPAAASAAASCCLSRQLLLQRGRMRACLGRHPWGAAPGCQSESLLPSRMWCARCACGRGLRLPAPPRPQSPPPRPPAPAPLPPAPAAGDSYGGAAVGQRRAPEARRGPAGRGGHRAHAVRSQAGWAARRPLWLGPFPLRAQLLAVALLGASAPVPSWRPCRHAPVRAACRALGRLGGWATSSQLQTGARLATPRATHRPCFATRRQPPCHQPARLRPAQPPESRMSDPRQLGPAGSFAAPGPTAPPAARRPPPQPRAALPAGTEQFATPGFVHTHRVGVCRGPYSPALVRAWQAYDKRKGSENDPVDLLPADQLYMVGLLPAPPHPTTPPRCGPSMPLSAPPQQWWRRHGAGGRCTPGAASAAQASAPGTTAPAASLRRR